MLDTSACPDRFDAPVIAAGRPSALPRPDAATVVGHRYAELQALFENLLPPTLEGDLRLRGTVTTFMGTSWMPRPLRRSIAIALGLILPWSAKEFRGAHGSNIWFGFRRWVRFLHYAVSQQVGADGNPVVWLDYDIPQNPAVFRRIRGEMRLLGPGLLLCRMQWKTSTGYFTVMYFTLGQE